MQYIVASECPLAHDATALIQTGTRRVQTPALNGATGALLADRVGLGFLIGTQTQGLPVHGDGLTQWRAESTANGPLGG